jgi:Zn-dependent peptidase ImmA (M78 family)
MIKALIEDAGLSVTACASLLGVDSVIFDGWLNGSRNLPGYIIPELSSVLGVSQADLLNGHARQAPAIWFKFKGDSKASDQDRELVLLIRRLGHFANQLDEVTSSPVRRWRPLFETIKKDRHSSPRIQGAEAAKELRDCLNLGFPALSHEKRNGDLIRPLLRNHGIMIIEAPIPRSKIEGCSFYVGEPGEERPCLFVNTYERTWFRRNHVLLHELAHAVFDIESEAALIDFQNPDGQSDVREIRADAFATDAFVPLRMLRHLQAMFGLHWERLSAYQLASLVAYSQVELNVILDAALAHEFITPELAQQYRKEHIQNELVDMTPRALSTREFKERSGEDAKFFLSTAIRTTTIPSRPLRLPVPYIVKVLEAVRDNLISESKAAEMLMIDDDVFSSRFQSLLPQAA